MGETKKPVCPRCGQEVKCFYSSQLVDGVFLKDKYGAVCFKCGWQETKQQHAGHHIGNSNFPQGTTCPFCGKSPAEHAQNFSPTEISVLIGRRRWGEEPVLHAPAPRQPAENQVALDNAPPLQPVAPAFTPPKRRPTPVPPPRTRKGNRTMRTVKKITDRMTKWSTKKIMVFYTILYAIALGMSAFIVGLWYGATIEGVLQETLVVAVLTAVVMTFFSLLILRYSRRFESPLLKHQGDGQ